MAHPRKQIRDAAVTALTGLTTTGSNVFESPIYPLTDADLPALRVFARGDSFGALDRGWTTAGSDWSGYSRTVELVVEAVVKTATTPFETIDTICEEVEAALEAKTAWTGVTGGEVVQVRYRNTIIDLSGESEIKQAVARVTYDVEYFSA